MAITLQVRKDSEVGVAILTDGSNDFNKNLSIPSKMYVILKKQFFCKQPTLLTIFHVCLFLFSACVG